MTYKTHSVFLLIRVLVLFLFLTLLAYSLNQSQFYLSLVAGFLCLIALYNLHEFVVRRFTKIDDFFESVKYRDFSRRFVEDLEPADIRSLHKGFNDVNRVVRETNAKKEVQYLYLQKILEMVDIGIIAYNLESGEVIWANDSLKNTLDLPSFKNINFVSRRRPTLFQEVFDNYPSEATSVSISVKNEKLKVLISDTIFQIEEESYKLIVLLNIDETLDQNESEAWKKLLSVMTHEIMNSIAPISSLADTLQNHVRLSSKNPGEYSLDLEDLDAGITSIKKRSEGLMKFATTYRSLNKVTQLNKEKVLIRELFSNIRHLMQPSITDGDIKINFQLDNPDLEVEMDSYLIEQVLINLILNSFDACKYQKEAQILISAKKENGVNTILRVQDNGTGIPEEIKDSIFVPFFTTKKNGSGIGLSLCKQIMLLHKGRIQLHSEENRGTSVNLIF